MRTLLSALAVLVVFGCGESVSPVVEAPDEVDTKQYTQPSVLERLRAEPLAFRMVPQASLGSFTTRRVLANATSVVPLEVADGWLDVQAGWDEKGEVLELSRFQAKLADVRLTSAMLPPNGLTLTDVRFSMPEPASLRVRWYGDGEVGWATGEVTVEIRTSLRLSTGEASPLEVARLEGMPVQLTVQRQQGVLAVSLATGKDGFLWSWADLFELSDVSMGVEAMEDLPAAPTPGAVVW